MVTVARRDAKAETLEAIYLAPATGSTRGAVLAPPHPLYGGSLDSPVLTELAFACTQAGVGSLRFNWRGVGASAGEPSGGALEADCDYGSALDHLAETVGGPLVAGGYSFGAAAALRAAVGNPRVTRVVLVSPPPQLVDAAAVARFIGRALIVTGALDAIAPPDALGVLAARARRGQFAVLPGCDHFFGAGLAELGREVSAWLAGGSR